MKLIAEERKAIYNARINNTNQKGEATRDTTRNELVGKWQESWQAMKNDGWMRKLIKGHGPTDALNKLTADYPKHYRATDVSKRI